jgi:hypothetical protein
VRGDAARRCDPWRLDGARGADLADERAAHVGDQGTAGLRRIWCSDSSEATGEFLIVELKRPPNKVEPDQKVWHRAFARRAAVNVQVWFVPDELDEWVAYLMSPSQRLKARRT